MKKRYITSGAIALAFMVLTFFVPRDVFAAPLVNIQTSPVKVGEKTTVTVTYAGDNVGRISGILTYDPAMLSYDDGGSSGNNGVIDISKAGEGGDIVIKLSFTALASGNTEVSVTTNSCYNLDEEFIQTPATSSAMIGIVSKEQAEEEEATDEEKKAEEEKAKEEKIKKEEAAQDEKQPADEEKEAKGGSGRTVYVLGVMIFLVAVGIVAAILLRRKKA